LAFIGVALALAGVLPARAYDAPAIVVPGRAGVPVIFYGGDASYCVVEGDWGLARPGHVAPSIVACPLVAPAPGHSGADYYVPGYYGSYFPAFGQRPGYGRLEVEPPPNRRLPPPAEGYYREWGARSDPQPATVDPPANIELNVAPQFDWRRRRIHRDD
jgi:hypothetical protein